MKKILYLVLTIVSIMGIVLSFFMPIFKFNDDKISKNDEQYIALMTSNEYRTLALDVNYNQLEKDGKTKANEYISETLTKYHSLINADKIGYYDKYAYKILNMIYQEKHPGSSPLNEESSADAVKSIEIVIIDDIGESAFKDKKDTYVDQEINKDIEKMYKDFLISLGFDTSTMSSDEIISNGKEYAIIGTKGLILDDLFLISIDLPDYDEELINEIIKDTTTKGMMLTQLFNTFKYGYQIDKAVFNKEEYKDLSFFKKLGAVRNDDNYYNPLPIILYSLVFLVIIINLLILFFNGLKGIKGKKRPKTFFKSTVMSILTIGLLLSSTLIPEKIYMSHHSENMTRLLDLLRCTDFTLLLYIYIGIFLYSLVLGIISIFFKFGKIKDKSKDKNK